ncbi:hypothetical protein [Williamwhitmania taraxaci]|uniref:Uncharacterized protein n=1 Tax=Williamwhitmania taraxaci TaxID=1640674 RepID=A0A1G6JT20_9BACT|nr:hypothetical protein [Williamwhitmania taraxaci]SDC21827.1 hypothetical protein SAMN05216323_102141 [Williamwhitmania taraxaci]
MKVSMFIIAFLFIQAITNGQDKTDKNTSSRCFIADVFMKLPFTSLNEEEKKELLKNTERVLDEERQTIEIDTINNFIFIQSCFIESMTMPCENYYIRSYLQKKNVYKIVYSNSSTCFADKHQQELEVYEYNLGTKVLMKDTTEYKVLKLSLKDFFKVNTPEIVLAKYSENVSPIYTFNGKRISCYISDAGYSNTLRNEPWLKGRDIEIEWDGNTFLIIKFIPYNDDNKSFEE